VAPTPAPRAPSPQPPEAELLAVIQSRPPGDPARQQACDTLVARYEPIVRSCVNRYRNSPEPTEDLMQVGYVGLMKAINNFDPTMGENLAAYALPCIKGEIKRHFRDKRWQIRVQRSAQELRLRIRTATADLTQRLARHPSDHELAQYLHVSDDDIADAQLASQVFQVASLDAPAGGDDSLHSLGELLGDDDPHLGHTIDMEAVRTHAQELPVREQRMLAMRFYGNMTQTEIGQRLGISQMHVSRLMRHALTQLRHKLTGTSAPTDGQQRVAGEATGGMGC
jgi:RNA polymerase sigma-B factor